MVYVVDINEGQAKEVVGEIEKEGGRGFAKAVDVAVQASVVALLGGIDRIDILVNSAGVSHIGTAETTKEADFDRLYNVNVKGVYNCLYAAIPVMKKNGAGGLSICVLLRRHWAYRTVLRIA